MNGDRRFPAAEELSLGEAAGLLNLDRRTVKKLIEQGVLPARLASPPNSRRPRYRLPAENVLSYRNTYKTFQRPARHEGKQAARRRGDDGFPHIRLRRAT
ncbi:hypothetical protein Pla108_14410 [Botrimarina colliarenosi]|uniref:Helix-turn-helix domain-containing protein n=1 Tax=Botrimarina colliarenosi TaxID=2528001 RepID=A0A5C6ALH4_9BACT|nr:helix-turn-helix domain-containing protein [Botrimarina colliarenosi]TWU00490.1 hypothetical protein Pla108_14410 [Botrimarina colliarenosi]